MTAYSKTIVVGNVAHDPELVTTKSDTELSIFALAIDRYKTKARKEKAEEEDNPTVDFHRVVCWGQKSKFVQKHLKKGTLVMVEGRLTNRNYNNKDGEKKYRTEIVAEEIEILNWQKEKTAGSLPNKELTTA